MPDPRKILLPATSGAGAIPITAIRPSDWSSLARQLDAASKRWAEANDFTGQAGRHLVMPGGKGTISRVLAGVSEAADANPFSLGRLCRALPPGTYAFDGSIADARLVALGWCLESYAFDAYRKTSTDSAKLVCPDGLDHVDILRAARAAFLTRDLINTPASDMGPDELENAARAVAGEYKAHVSVAKGKAQ